MLLVCFLGNFEISKQDFSLFVCGHSECMAAVLLLALYSKSGYVLIWMYECVCLYVCMSAECIDVVKDVENKLNCQTCKFKRIGAYFNKWSAYLAEFNSVYNSNLMRKGIIDSSNSNSHSFSDNEQQQQQQISRNKRNNKQQTFAWYWQYVVDDDNDADDDVVAPTRTMTLLQSLIVVLMVSW